MVPEIGIKLNEIYIDQNEIHNDQKEITERLYSIIQHQHSSSFILQLVNTSLPSSCIRFAKSVFIAKAKGEVHGSFRPSDLEFRLSPLQVLFCRAKMH